MSQELLKVLEYTCEQEVPHPQTLHFSGMEIWVLWTYKVQLQIQEDRVLNSCHP